MLKVIDITVVGGVGGVGGVGWGGDWLSLVSAEMNHSLEAFNNLPCMAEEAAWSLHACLWQLVSKMSFKLTVLFAGLTGSGEE